EFGLLSGGATAICGASAAMAISAALPPDDRKERLTGFTIIGVSTLSTVAMVLYPIVSQLFGFGDHQAGLFIGATVHDVAQVVGAGYA
ncbi:putative sulfate exporter family transporter, partial [Halalkalibacter lacteus]|uniref:putative sulfate exporter family transporter n=1 Tax=Halalkalibacter lacteus TaxID=3090663 RepID=UPI002FC9A87C